MSALSYKTEMVIGSAPENVFDYCSDLCSELRWNPKVKYVEKLTDGPVAAAAPGARYTVRAPPSADNQVRWSGLSPRQRSQQRP